MLFVGWYVCNVSSTDPRWRCPSVALARDSTHAGNVVEDKRSGDRWMTCRFEYKRNIVGMSAGTVWRACAVLLLGELARCACAGTSDRTAAHSAEYDAIVVGLGAAGCAAAGRLARAGRRVLALEGQPRVGGRVKTVPFGDGLVEEGAEWIHGEFDELGPSPTFAAALEHNVSIARQQLRHAVFRSDGSSDHERDILDMVAYVIDELPVTETDPSVTYGDYVTGRLLEHLRTARPDVYHNEELVNMTLRLLNMISNSLDATNDWKDVSVVQQWRELEGDQNWSWGRHGYKTFFEIMLGTYKNGSGIDNLDIKLRTEVSNVQYPQAAHEPVLVTTAAGHVYRARSAVLSVSLGVLKERSHTLFSPPLPPEKLAAIQLLDIGVVDKIILSFRERWWPANITYFVFVWKEHDLEKIPAADSWTSDIFSATTPAGSGNTLTVWTSGDNAKLVERLPESEVVRKVMAVLRQFLGRVYSVSEPLAVIRSTWFSNPFTRGSYSFASPAATRPPAPRAALAAPLLDGAGSPRVLFAGEHTHRTHYATVHGAAESGAREAARLLAGAT